MLSSHALSSEQPSGEGGDGQLKRIGERTAAKLSVSGDSREKNM